MSKGNSGGGAGVGGGGVGGAASATIDMKAVNSMNSQAGRQIREWERAKASGNEQKAKQHRYAAFGYNKAAKLHEQGKTSEANATAKVAKEYANGTRKA